MTSPAAPSPTDLAYSIPSIYTNNVAIVYVNGVFRVTFFEQQLSQIPPSPEVRETLAVRCSVTMTPTTASDFIKHFEGLFHAIAQNVQTQAATVMPEQGGGRAN